MHYVYLHHRGDMRTNIDILKGIHPGKIIGRELRKRNTSQRSFAASIGEHSQALNAVITGHRHLTTELAVKLEQAFGYEEGFLLALQAYYDVVEYKRKLATGSVTGTPDIRKSLFWDTDFDKLDWGRYKTAAIQRVLERGDEREKREIARFYDIPFAELSKYAPANSYRIRITRTNK